MMMMAGKLAAICVCLAFVTTIGVVQADSDCGSQESDWTEIEGFQIRGFTGTQIDGTVEDCKAKCVADDTCMSFDYFTEDDQCTLSEKNQYSEDVFTDDTDSVTYYELTCRGESGEDHSVESGSGSNETDGSPCKDKNDDHDSLLDIMENNPEYAALVGMGALVLILLITAICAICILSPSYSNDSLRKR